MAPAAQILPGLVQDERVKRAIEDATNVMLELLPLPEGAEAVAKVAIAFGIQKLLKGLGVETGKVTIEAGPDVKVRVVVRR